MDQKIIDDIMPGTTVLFKRAGHLVTYSKSHLALLEKEKDFIKAVPATQEEMDNYKDYNVFMNLSKKYLDKIEHHAYGRPNPKQRFRYDANDMMNLMAFLMKGKEPADVKPDLQVVED